MAEETKVKEFEPFTVNSQEEFDARIGERIGRLNARHSEATAELQNNIDALTKENAALIEESKKMEERYAEFDKIIADKDDVIKKYESASVKARIAHEYDIPYELQPLITGSDEEEMKQTAALLSRHTHGNAVPLATAEPAHSNDEGSAYNSAMRDFANQIMNNKEK